MKSRPVFATTFLVLFCLFLFGSIANAGPADDQKVNSEFHNAYYKHKDMMHAHFIPMLGGLPPIDDSPRMRKRRARMARFWKNAKEDTGLVELLKTAKQVLAAMNADCTGKLKNVTDDRLNQDRKWKTEWCKVAARGDEMLKFVVRKKVRDAAGGLRDGFLLQAEKLDDCKGVLREWEQSYYLNPKAAQAKILERFKLALQAIGNPDTSSLFVDVDKALADLLVKIEAKVPEWKFSPDGSKSNEPLVVTTYKRTFPGVKIMQVTLITRDWQIRKNGLGIPTHRTKSGKILFKLPQENKWCRSDKWVYLQDYTGGGRYGKSYFEMSPDKGFNGIVSCP